jgi:hypothetical protein
LAKVWIGIKHLGRILTKPFILLPLIYLLLNNVFPPAYGTMIQYIFTKKLGVSVQDLAIVDNVGGILYYIAFLSFINKLKGVPLWKLFILGNLSNLAMLFEFAPFFDFPNWL